MATRRRLDAELVRRGLARSRRHASELLDAHRVTVGGSIAAKPARLVAPSEPVVVAGRPDRYVGRGAYKLAAALERFGVTVTDRRVIDVGSSTGGFTDCLLQHGAVAVVAIDVGRAQLHERLSADPRVRSLEQRNVRGLEPEAIGGPAELVVADLSFISLATVAADLCRLAAPDGELIVLIKPQFEAGREEASRARGVIRDPAIWTRVIESVRAAFEPLGTTMMEVMPSPVLGAEGNVEFLAHLRRGDPLDGVATAEIDAAVAAATELGGR